MFHPEGPTFWELARQALSSTERGYDLLAPKFDVTPFRTPDALLEAAAPYVGPPGSVESAVDLCCGTGAVLEMLAPLTRRRLVGVDFSRGMLEVARERLASSEGAAAVELVRADVLDLAFDADFDVATCFSAIGHFRRREHPHLVRGIARALRPGGRFVTISARLPPPWSWPLWVALLFNAAMAVRNAVWRPPFVMFYLNFLMPAAGRTLEENGFEVETFEGFCPRFPRCCLLVGTRSDLPVVPR